MEIPNFFLIIYILFVFQMTLSQIYPQICTIFHSLKTLLHMKYWYVASLKKNTRFQWKTVNIEVPPKNLNKIFFNFPHKKTIFRVDLRGVLYSSLQQCVFSCEIRSFVPTWKNGKSTFDLKLKFQVFSANKLLV